MTNATFTTPAGTKIVMTLVGEVIEATANGAPFSTADCIKDGMVRFWNNKYAPIPAEARADVDAVFAARNEAIRAKYLASDEAASDRMRARMYNRNSIH